MRIALEMLGLIPGQVGGMEAYARNLIKGLSNARPSHEFLLLVGREAKGTFAEARCRFEEFVADTSMPSWCGGFRYCQSAWHLAASIKKLKSWKHDVLHCIMTLPKPPWGAKNMVLTIHDLNFESLPELWGRGQLLAMKTLCRLGAKVADRIITVSNDAKRTIVERYSVPEARIDVIFIGIDREVFSPSLDKIRDSEAITHFHLPTEFLVFPANTWPHKNHLGLLEALAILRDEFRLAPYVVLTGTQKHGHAKMLNATASLGLKNQIRWLGYVTRHELVALYRRAHALVFPSLYEGFGVPVIEAMACRCPVVCSKTTATGEVAGGAALTFDPNDPADIATGIARIITDGALRQDLIAKGQNRAADFSLDRMARETLRIYEEVASGR